MQQLKFTIYLIISVVCFCGIIEACNATAQELVPEANGRAVESAIWSLVKASPRNKAHKASYRKELSRHIAESSRRYGVDSLLVVTVIYCESSFNSGSVGSIGERGLMQVHGAARRGCDLSTAGGQIDCGVKWLQVAKQSCGTIRGALTAYATGRCNTEDKRVRWMINHRLEIWGELKNEIQ